MESILETKAVTILQFFAGLRGTLWVTLEEETLRRLAVRPGVEQSIPVLPTIQPGCVS
jgi:hypothetical protein